MQVLSLRIHKPLGWLTDLELIADPFTGQETIY